MSTFLFATGATVAQPTNRRAGETKLGEMVSTISAWEELDNHPAKYVLLGIPEDIGIRANYGTGGAAATWQPALKSLLNIQSTPQFTGEELIIAGAFDFSGLMEQSQDASISELRAMTAEIDGYVAPIIEKIAAADKTPIIIGGGHNNAYPIIKGCAMAKGKAINAINLDAHTDYRSLEGRHSGNGFRYAKHHDNLDKYAIVALHRNYNNPTIIRELIDDEAFHLSFYEDIFLEEQQSFGSAVAKGLAHVQQSSFGIELDLDCIENILSSAMTPCGISGVHARQYLHHAGLQHNCCYLHLTEGAVLLNDGRENLLTAKLIAYLISDFVRAGS